MRGAKFRLDNIFLTIDITTTFGTFGDAALGEVRPDRPRHQVFIGRRDAFLARRENNIVQPSGVAVLRQRQTHGLLAAGGGRDGRRAGGHRLAAAHVVQRETHALRHHAQGRVGVGRVQVPV